MLHVRHNIAVTFNNIIFFFYYFKYYIQCFAVKKDNHITLEKIEEIK